MTTPLDSTCVCLRRRQRLPANCILLLPWLSDLAFQNHTFKLLYARKYFCNILHWIIIIYYWYRYSLGLFVLIVINEIGHVSLFFVVIGWFSTKNHGRECQKPKWWMAIGWCLLALNSRKTVTVRGRSPAAIRCALPAEEFIVIHS